jgi:hypothetical protein
MSSLVKLNKYLYGLRSAANDWRQLLGFALKGFGFYRLKTDACVYKLTVLDQNINGTLIFGVFMDGILCLDNPVYLLFSGFNPFHRSKFPSPLNLMLNHLCVYM